MQENKAMMRMIAISRENDWFVASDIVTHVASQGKTYDEAVANLKEALILYFDDEDIVSENDEMPMVTTIEVPI